MNVKLDMHHYIAIASLFFIILCSCFIANANPIPVFPDPEPVYQSPITYVSSNHSISFWIPLVFLFDFAANLLVLYLGFFLLLKLRWMQYDYFVEISRKQFIVAAGIISVLGIVSEFLLGTWYIGLIFVLGIVFVSYFYVSSYIFHLSKRNCFVISFCAVMINIITWMIVFQIF